MDIDLNKNQYLEFEKISIGAFAPLDGFMREKQFLSVVNDMRLEDGSIFPLPVYLDVGSEIANMCAHAPIVSLRYKSELVGKLYVEDIYRLNKPDFTVKLFGTSDIQHPGVQHFLNSKEYFIGGKVELVSRVKLDFSQFELLPSETKAIFSERGWRKIAGFQTRNVPHMAHEYLQRIALEHSDGLFIQPLVGRKKVGDYNPSAILNGYNALINNYFPRQKIVLGVLSTAMRYAGPREAIFHAIIRRNYGCTHFIVGRDHAGVGNYYKKYEAHDLCRSVERELGIEIMYLHGPFYCGRCKAISTEMSCGHSGESQYVNEISGTDMRRIFSTGLLPNEYVMRKEVVDAVNNDNLFIKEDEL